MSGETSTLAGAVETGLRVAMRDEGVDPNASLDSLKRVADACVSPNGTSNGGITAVATADLASVARLVSVLLRRECARAFSDLAEAAEKDLLRLDAARMKWLEDAAATVRPNLSMCDDSEPAWTVTGADSGQWTGATLRECIDAAIVAGRAA